MISTVNRLSQTRERTSLESSSRPPQWRKCEVLAQEGVRLVCLRKRLRERRLAIELKGVAHLQVGLARAVESSATLK